MSGGHPVYLPGDQLPEKETTTEGMGTSASELQPAIRMCV